MTEKQTTLLIRSGVILAAAGTLLMITYAYQAFDASGAKNDITPTISVSGEGKHFVAPDMATVSFAIRAEAKTQTEATTAVNTKMEKLVGALRDAGLSEKDIKTTSYNLYPQYDYIQQVCPQAEIGRAIPCVPGKQQLRGYEVSQHIEVSMKGKKNFDNAAQFVDIITKQGATDMSQLSFGVENPEEAQAVARNAAIEEAKSKAKVLAKQLGVDLVRITGFSEGGSAPYYAERMMMKGAGMMDQATPAPTLPVGQNEFRITVNLTYEIAE